MNIDTLFIVDLGASEQKELLHALHEQSLLLVNAIIATKESKGSRSFGWLCRQAEILNYMLDVIRKFDNTNFVPEELEEGTSTHDEVEWIADYLLSLDSEWAQQRGKNLKAVI